jgi:hypothetical protein
MTSYIPEHYYGAVHDANGRWTGQYGLVPWPDHLKPREPEPSGVELTKKGEAYAEAALAEAKGVFFVTLSQDDRAGIATTIERLIDMLDAFDGDENLEATGDDEPLHGWPNAGQPINEAMCADDDREVDNADWEPSLGSVQWYPHSQENLACGVRMSPSNNLRRTFDGSQEKWASGSGDDREEECEDEGAQDDREHSLGWQDEGSQANLSGSYGDGDLEADLGSTEEIDQARRLEIAAGAMAGLDEPDLGWAESAGKGIVGRQNCLDDREHDDERQDDPAEHGIADDDAPTALLMAQSPARREQARRLPDGTIVRSFQPSDAEMLIAQLDPEKLRALHYPATTERLQ